MKISNVFIAAIFLVLIAVFSLNFEKLTGYVPRENGIPEVSVNPKSVKSGEKIDIRVKVNGFCVDPEFEIVTDKGLHKDNKLYMPTEDDCEGQNFHTCKGSKYCKGNIIGDILKLNYKTQADFEGDYKVRVRYIEKPGQDRYDTPFVDVGFEVV
ncbi:MAG: hypothetical protein CMH63_02835 [Nanoarchaeota archaeon]|nr:hypothetical protein [Nanoarchaeota archaeon]|tara:strand:- start:6523 stop:6984 length:462 start_codon:yes stop_codon:yes gene_type:complete